MKRWEKTLLFILLVALITCSISLLYRYYLKNTHLVPAYGDIYTEGIVADNKSDIDKTIKKLTGFGLTYFDNQGKIQPGLASSWDISNDGKIYTFHLREGVDSNKLVETIKSYKNGWNDIDITNSDQKTLTFALKQPYSPFLSSTAEPIFNYGPYNLDSQDKNQIVLKAQKSFFVGQPYISKIVIKLYPDEGNLLKAVKKDKLDGVVGTEQELKGLKVFKMDLSRYLMVFFNLNREQFQDKQVRQKIKNNQKLDKEISVTLVTSDKAENLSKAQELKNQWNSLGLKIDIKLYDVATLQKEIIPNRDYDILLYGIDYGYDPDPYPFWHTSQMGGAGLNLSNFSDQKADALLEEARQTTDVNQRVDKYKQFQQIFDEEVPAIVLEQYSTSYQISSRVKGPEQHNGFDLSDRYNEVWKWYIKEKRIDK